MNFELKHVFITSHTKGKLGPRLITVLFYVKRFCKNTFTKYLVVLKAIPEPC